MTTPLGEIEVGPREGRRVTIARRPTRPRSPSRSVSTARVTPASITGIGFFDHLLGSLAHHGLFDLAIHADGDLQIDEHHTVEDVALVLGAAFAEALGDRTGIARFGQSSVPMDESPGDGRRRRRRPAVCGHRPSVPRRARRRPAAPARRARARIVRPDGRRDAPRDRAPAATTTTSPRPPSRRWAERSGSPARSTRGARVSPRPRGPSDDDARAGRAIAVVDYGAGNLVSIDQALTTVGADVVIARDADALAGADALIVPGVGAAAPAMARLDAGGLTEPIRAGLGATGRSSASASGCSCSSTRATRTARRPSGSCRAGRASALPTRRPSRTSAGTRSSGRAPPALRRHRRRRRLLLRPLVRGCARGRRARRRLATTEHGGRSSRQSRAARWSASSSIRAERPLTACELLANFVDLVSSRLMLCRRVIPCLDVADGRVVKGTRFVDLVDEGDPSGTRRALRRRGRRRARLPRHQLPRPNDAARSSTSSSGRLGVRSSR